MDYLDTEIGNLKEEYEEEVRTLETVIVQLREELSAANERAEASEREVGVVWYPNHSSTPSLAHPLQHTLATYPFQYTLLLLLVLTHGCPCLNYIQCMSSSYNRITHSQNILSHPINSINTPHTHLTSLTHTPLPSPPPL